MFDLLTSTRTALQGLAREFEPTTLTGEQAVRVVEDLGVIHRLTEGLLAKAAKRVADTSAHERNGDRDAVQFYARAVGVEASEARRVIDTAKRLEKLPDTEAAVREGRLSARQAQLVAEAAAHNPELEHELLAAAGEGMVPLKDACVVARAHVEDETVRAARQHAARRLRMWTASDGMVEGHFKLEPAVGGRFKVLVDSGTQRIFRSQANGTAGGSSRGSSPVHHGHAATSHACQGSRVLGVCVAPPTPERIFAPELRRE